jgi:SAM-dependent methyltransferase
MNPSTREQIHDAVRDVYGKLARRQESEKDGACCAPSCCKNEVSAESTPQSPDYTPAEIASVPKGAYLGAGSGAPVKYLSLQPGEVVVDLGAGAGMDTFLAANAVGRTGRVHGFDLTPDMLERARRNAAAGPYGNVTFHQTDIERLPLPDAVADAATSNCVINLTPDKAAVYRELYRVLKPGGRFSVADIVLRGDAAAIEHFRQRSDRASWCSCTSGALHESDYLGAIRAAGFDDVRVVAERPAETQPGQGVLTAAVTITGRKPA